EMAVRLVISSYYNDPDLIIESSLEQAIQEANQQIHQRGQTDPYLRGMGTTFVAIVIRNQELVVANVGDSRAYLLRQGELWQLSLDHTAVQEQVREGLLTPEEGSVHPRRHVLSRNLGSRPRAQPDFDSKTLVAGDTLMLCSDGLWGPVSDDEIDELLQRQRGAEAAQSFVELANEHGGPDNISVIVVNVNEPTASPAHVIIEGPAVDASLDGAITQPQPVVASPQPAAAPVPARKTGRWAALSAAALVVVLIGAFLLRNTVFGGSAPTAAIPPDPSVVAGSSQPSPSSSAELAAAPATIVAATATASATPASTPTQQPTSRPTQTPEIDVTPLATRRHSGPVDGLAFAPDGNQLVLGSIDTLELWDVQATSLAPAALSATPGSAAQTQTAPSLTPEASSTAAVVDCGPASRAHGILSLAFSADGTAWAAAPNGSAVEVWDVSSGRGLANPIAHPTAVTSAVWSADGQQLASAAANGVVIVRQIDDGTFVTIATNDSPVCSLAFSSDGQILATGAQDGSLDLWRTGDGEHLETLEQHEGPVAALVFAPNPETGAEAQDQHMLASVEQDGTIKLWQLSSNTFETSASTSSTATATSSAPAATLEPTRSHLPFLTLHHAAPVSGVAFAPNGQLLASAGQDGIVALWQIGDRILNPQADGNRSPALIPGTTPIGRLIHRSPVGSVAFAPDSRTLVSGTDDGVVRLWPVTTTKPERKQLTTPTATPAGRRKSA
ncbi:MAG: SpoIIE family protein phosphatase, partial [Chloroflexi bacterium]|nr:SpoIIE family protein phosphatase [Chloroflexota bacterium]